jgi:enoyl-CoA hydratase/carnithine racemase
MGETGGMQLEKSGSVWVLNLGDTENRFNDDSIAELTAHLDEVTADREPHALVTTADGKFWSNGLDLDWLGEGRERLPELIVKVQNVFADVLGAEFPTVAALQGHAFAAGAMLAISHDLRVMRDDRGWMCFPEIDIAMTFTSGMNLLVSSKLNPPVAHQAMVFGRRFTAPEALAAGMIDATAPADDVLSTAVDQAGALVGKDPASLGAIKRMLYAPALAALREGR